MNFNEELEFAFKEVQGSTAWGMDRGRPYNGQSHTLCGKRGSEEVKGLTMRDIADCAVHAFLGCYGIARENPIWDDVYTKGTEEDIDPIAVVQNMCVEIEKMMGIYPNAPKPKVDE